MDLNALYGKFLDRSIVERVIVINVILFILTYLSNTVSFLMDGSGDFMVEWLSLSPSFGELLFKPWTLISYGFIHAGFFHILFNMLVLYYFGLLFLDFFSKQQFLTYYLLGIIAGGLVYMLSYNFLPALKTQETILLGASAGVTCVMVGIASHIPHYSMRLILIGSVKLMYIAGVLVLLDLIQIPNGNAGGHLAHLGGAAMGFFLTTYMNQGRGLSSLFAPKVKKRKKKSPLKTVYKRGRAGRQQESGFDQQRVDAILDKISKSGYDALSKEEKDYLFKAGKQ